MTQAEIARTMGTSEMQISRLARALYRERLPLSDLDALKILAVPEVMAAGFTTSVAVELLVKFASEVSYLSADPERRCWIAFCIHNEDDDEVQLSALKAHRLQSIIDSHPVSLILPMHNVVAAARAELNRIKNRSAA
ncbi:hypothetical protein [Aquamicrobium ahrensii]|uniref:HTH cro/C1-type domain-containing protein n=1 Tax=Aquamicrobium ahrensii TaxID=469551 RepID=A0ABV2KFW7_9HYPH